jgi:hypothetical protein
VTRAAPRAKVAQTVVRATAKGKARIVVPRALSIRPWNANSSNVAAVSGRVLWNGRPVAGARVAVDGYRLLRATDRNGRFQFDDDITMPARRTVRVVSAAGATVGGRRLSAAQQAAVLRARAGVSVGYRLSGLRARVSGGKVVVTGRVSDTKGNAPPAVRLLTYRLSGTITDASGKPVQGAVVITRTQDRDFWTHSSATDANGKYTSYFAASDETEANPVPLSIGVALGRTSYGGNLGTIANFSRLKSATMNIRLGSGTSYTIETPSSYTGAVYSGLVVGVTAGGKVVKPLAATWPDARGNFSITLPASVRGKTLTFWQNQRQSFSSVPARPGGRMDLGTWPVQLGDAVPTGLAALKVGR